MNTVLWSLEIKIIIYGLIYILKSMSYVCFIIKKILSKYNFILDLPKKVFTMSFFYIK